MRKLLLLSMLLAVISFCGYSQPSSQQPQKMTQVEIKTSLGDIVVELYNETPKHRDNFLKLVNEHYYDGVLFHRVIKDFMVQTGDGNSKTAGPNDMLGNGDLDYTVPAEFVYPKYFHKRGALAAARTGDQVNPERASSGSQFYIVTGKVYNEPTLNMMEERLGDGKKQEIFQRRAMEHRTEIMDMQSKVDTTGLMALQNKLIEETEKEYALSPVKFTPEQIQAYSTIGGTPHLDGAYTVYGEVVSGMEVVDKIQNSETGANDRPVQDIRIISMRVLP